MHERPRSRALWIALPALTAIVALAFPEIAWADGGNEFEQYRAQGWLWAYLGAFGAGVATSLTPCVYPMIPIVVGIFGGRGKDVPRRRAVLLATMYVIGMGITFALLGTLFALIGGKAGALLAKPAVVIPLVGVYLVLAASMFGAFELQLPASMRNAVAGVSGTGVRGAFTMGLVGGFTAAPCTGPFLLGLLGFVTTTQSVAIGASLLFTYALGMGVLFWALAAFSLALPKSGAWMEWMKSIGGVALLVAAIHFVRPVVPWLDAAVLPSRGFLVAAIAVALGGIGLGAIHLSFHDRAAIRARKALAIGLTTIGITAAVSWTLHVDRHLPWIRSDETLAFAQARREGKGVMIDFSATWCTPCKELEHTFAQAPVFQAITDNFVPLQFDVTAGTDRDDELQAKYDAGTPTVVFVRADGRVVGRIKKYVDATEFLAAVAPAIAQLSR